MQLNKLIWEGGHDLVLSIGQVVPHEVLVRRHQHEENPGWQSVSS